MAIDARIALGVQPVQQQPNMLAQYAQVMGIKAAQQEMEGNNALREAYASGGDLNDPAFRQRVMAANPKVGSQLIKTNAETGKLQNEAVLKRIELSREMLTGVNTPEDYLSWHESNHKDPVLGSYLNQRGVTAEQSRAKIIAALNTPGGLEKLKRESALGAGKLQQELMQTERSVQVAGIGAAPGMMNANLAREKYTDQLRSGGDIVTSTVPDPENPTQRIEMQFRRDLRTGQLIPLEIQAPPMRVDISPTSATSTYETGGGAPTNVLATQVAPQGGVAPAANVNGLNPNAPQTQGPILARPLPKVPSGPLAAYRKTADGTGLEPIPGGPADPAVKALQATETLSAKDIAARNAKYPQATSALKGFEAKTGKFERDIDELIANEKGLNEITGFLAGRTDLSAMTKEGRRALALFNTITAKGGFSELQDMRNASPTGGALGNVSNQEGKQLIDSVGALARTQDANDLRKSLITLKSDLQGSKQRVREAYDLTYEYRIPAGTAPNAATPEPSNAPPTIKTEAEYNALPSGATYVDPDGVSRRKR
jgi:hypothetical protein